MKHPAVPVGGCHTSQIESIYCGGDGGVMAVVEETISGVDVVVMGKSMFVVFSRDSEREGTVVRQW